MFFSLVLAYAVGRAHLGRLGEEGDDGGEGEGVVSFFPVRLCRLGGGGRRGLELQPLVEGVGEGAVGL